MNLGINLQNIADNDGIAISITGMTIVFLGLILVSVFIAFLPAALAFHDRFRVRRHVDEAEAAEEDERIDREVAAALAMVLERAMTPEDGSTFQRITIRKGVGDSVWKQGGRLQILSARLPRGREGR